tara:strand:+ start:94563 stop:95567 length:1005 start_codon:yes stop_codon:yes gene_type:complete
MADVESKTPIERAAILLMMLSPSEASKVMKYLVPKQVQKLGAVMASIKDVDNESINHVVGEFLDKVNNQSALGIDNAIHVREVLANTIGDEKADAILDDALMQANNKGLENLKWMDAYTISEFIKNEHPQIQSIILSYLDPDQAAEVLLHFDDKQQLDLMMRISVQDTIQPDAISELDKMLMEQLTKINVKKPKAMGGIKCAAEILNHINNDVEAEIFAGIKKEDEGLANNIQELMFVFENILSIDDRDMQTLLRELDTDSLVLSLKGASSEIANKIYKNMSKRAAALLKDDLEAKGPVKLTDVEEAQKSVLMIAKKLADSGDISLGGKGEEMV